MAHSYLEFRGDRVLLSDSDIVVVARLMMSAQGRGTPTQLIEMFEWWNESLDYSGPGCIDLRLDHFLKDPRILRQVCELMAETLARLYTCGPEISAAQLNSISKEGARFVRNKKTEGFIAAAKRIEKLLGCSL